MVTVWFIIFYYKMDKKHKNKTKAVLVQGIDYYFNEQGYWVFTAKYLLDRGYCCNNGCKHCPYNKANNDCLTSIDTD
jgi:hypothetical protein